jgi:hypothetical protein
VSAAADTDVPMRTVRRGGNSRMLSWNVIRSTVAVNPRVDTFGGWFERLAQTQSGATTLKTKIEVH